MMSISEKRKRDKEMVQAGRHDTYKYSKSHVIETGNIRVSGPVARDTETSEVTCYEGHRFRAI